MPGIFYPHTLNSYWYKEDVCYSIQKSLETMKEWLAPTKHNRERRAYLEIYADCQDVCARNKMNPQLMLEVLDLIQVGLKARPKPWVLSLDNWVYETQQYREKAVADCIDIVKAYTRYLPL